MSLFKKKDEKSSDRPVLFYPIQPMILSEHQENLLRVLKDVDLNELHESGRMSLYLRSAIALDDNGSFQVFAGPKGSRANALSPVARIPAEYNDMIKSDTKKAVTGSHYWSLKLTISIFHEAHLYLSLNESKFNR